MRFLRSALVGLSMAGLAGCDLAPHYHVPLTPVPTTYKGDTAWHLADPTASLKQDGWWTLYGDPTLDALEEKVDQASPTLAAALAAYKRSRALATESESGLFPQIAVGGQINSVRQSNRRPRRGLGQPNSYEDNAIEVQAKYEIDFWGHIANEVRAGRYMAQAAAAQLADTRLLLHADLANDYVALRGLDAQADVLARSVKIYERGVALTRNRFQGAIAPMIDVTRAESQLQDAKAQLTDCLSHRALYEHAIATMIGEPASSFTVPVESWRLTVPALSAGMPSSLLERRPDIAEAERQVAAANATIGVTRAAFYPTISMNLIYGLEATSFNIFSLPNDFWAVGPGLMLPIFEGGLRDAEEKAAVEAAKMAAAHYKQTVLEAFQETEDRLSELKLLGREQQERQAQDAAAEQSLAIATNLYKDGATNFLDVVVAQNEALRAEQAMVRVRTQRIQASVGLVRTLGGGWNKDAPPEG